MVGLRDLVETADHPRRVRAADVVYELHEVGVLGEVVPAGGGVNRALDGGRIAEREEARLDERHARGRMFKASIFRPS